jgi:transcription elongation factor Elf1
MTSKLGDVECPHCRHVTVGYLAKWEDRPDYMQKLTCGECKKVSELHIECSRTYTCVIGSIERKCDACGAMGKTSSEVGQDDYFKCGVCNDIEDTETVSVDTLTCPHCGFEEYGVYNYEEFTEDGAIECINCGKLMEVSVGGNLRYCCSKLWKDFDREVEDESDFENSDTSSCYGLECPYCEDMDSDIKGYRDGDTVECGNCAKQMYLSITGRAEFRCSKIRAGLGNKAHKMTPEI